MLVFINYTPPVLRFSHDLHLPLHLVLDLICLHPAIFMMFFFRGGGCKPGIVSSIYLWLPRACGCMCVCGRVWRVRGLVCVSACQERERVCVVGGG